MKYLSTLRCFFMLAIGLLAVATSWQSAHAQALSISPTSWLNIPPSPSAAQLGLETVTGTPARVAYRAGSEKDFRFGPDDAPQNMGSAFAGANFIRWTGTGTFRPQATSVPLAGSDGVYAVRMMLSFTTPDPVTLAGSDDSHLFTLNLNSAGVWIRFHLRNGTGQAGDKIYRGAYLIQSTNAGGGTIHNFAGSDGVNNQAYVPLNTPFELTVAIQNSNPGWVAIYIDRQLVSLRTGADMPTALGANGGNWTFNALPLGAVTGMSVNLHPKIETWTTSGFMKAAWRPWPSNYDLTDYLGTTAPPAAVAAPASFNDAHVWRISSLTGNAAIAATQYASSGVNPGFGRFVMSGDAATVAVLKSLPEPRDIEYNENGWAFGAVTSFLVPAAAASMQVSLLNPSDAVLGQFIVTDQRLFWRNDASSPSVYIADILTGSRYGLQWAVNRDTGETRATLIDWTASYTTTVTISTATIKPLFHLFPGGKTPRVEVTMTQGASGGVEFGAVAFGKWFTVTGVDSRTAADTTSLTPVLTSVANNMTFPTARGQPFLTPGYAHRPTKPTSPNLPDMQILGTLGRSGMRLTELADQADVLYNARALRLFTVCHSVNDFGSIATLGREPWVNTMTAARKLLFGGLLAGGNQVIFTSEAQGTDTAFSSAETDWVINREFNDFCRAIANEQTKGQLFVLDVRNKATTLFRGTSDNLHISGEGARNYAALVSGVLGSGRRSALMKVVPNPTATEGFSLVPAE